MCTLIYLTIAGLLLLYSDALLNDFALAVPGEAGEWMVVALGWELVPLLWPLPLIGFLLGSFATWLVMRRRTG
jgi:membrane protein implicated in regulation of membrane protease activity